MTDQQRADLEALRVELFAALAELRAAEPLAEDSADERTPLLDELVAVQSDHACERRSSGDDGSAVRAHDPG